MHVSKPIHVLILCGGALLGAVFTAFFQTSELPAKPLPHSSAAEPENAEITASKDAAAKSDTAVAETSRGATTVAPAPRQPAAQSNTADGGDRVPPPTQQPNEAGATKQTPALGASNAVTNAPETIVELPPDLSAPAVLAGADSASALSPAQQKLTDQIAENFVQQIESGTGNANNGEAGVDPAKWKAAQSNADSRYRLLFGDAAYNQQSLKGAQEKMSGSSQP